MRYFVTFIISCWGIIFLNSYLWILIGMPYHLPQPHCGDLARLGSIFYIGDCRVETRPNGDDGFVPLEIAMNNGNIKFDTVFGGDSFARGRASGPDNYFQSLYARSTGERVTYINDVGDNQYLSYAPVLKQGIFKELGASKFYLIMAEKNAVRAFSRAHTFDEMANSSTKTADEIFQYRKKVDQTGYMDSRHIDSALLVKKIKTEPYLMNKAIQTYAFFSILWKPWSEIMMALNHLADDWEQIKQKNNINNDIVTNILSATSSTLNSPDQFTKVAKDVYGGYPAQVMLRQATHFDIKFSLRSLLRYACNRVSKSLVDSYVCDNGLLYQPKLNAAGKKLFKGGDSLKKLSQSMGKVKDNKTLEKLVDETLTARGEGRRDFNKLVASGGVMVALQSIGLGGIKAAKTKSAPDAVLTLKTLIDDSDEMTENGLMAIGRQSSLIDVSGLTDAVKKSLAVIMKNRKNTFGDKVLKNKVKGKDGKFTDDYEDISTEEAAYIMEELQKRGHNVKFEHYDDMGGQGVDDILDKFKNNDFYKGTKLGKENYDKFSKKVAKMTDKEKIAYHTSITDDAGNYYDEFVEELLDMNFKNSTK